MQGDAGLTARCSRGSLASVPVMSAVAAAGLTHAKRVSMHSLLPQS